MIVLEERWRIELDAERWIGSLVNGSFVSFFMTTSHSHFNADVTLVSLIEAEKEQG